MKKQLTLLFVLLAFGLQSQTLNEKDVIKKEHIDFSKEHILFVLYGEIEINGHTFLNHKAEKPIRYRANLDKVILSDGETEYTHRLCELDGCKVIHLVKKDYNSVLTAPPYYWGWDRMLLDYNITPTDLIIIGDHDVILHDK